MPKTRQSGIVNAVGVCEVRFVHALFSLDRCLGHFCQVDIWVKGVGKLMVMHYTLPVITLRSCIIGGVRFLLEVIQLFILQL